MFANYKHDIIIINAGHRYDTFNSQVQNVFSLVTFNYENTRKCQTVKSTDYAVHQSVLRVFIV